MKGINKFVDLCAYPEVCTDKPIAIDTETLGNTKRANLPIYFSWSNKDFGSGAGPILTERGYTFLQELCEAQVPKVFHNAAFDLAVLKKAGLEVKGQIEDTTLMHMLLDEHHLGYHRLKVLSRELLQRSRLDELNLKEAQMKVHSNLQLPQKVLHDYAIPDAVDALDLYILFRPQLEQKNLLELYRTEVAVEMVYMQMSEVGIAIDLQEIDKTLEKIGHTVSELEERIYSAFGERFRLSSSSPELGNTLAKHFPLREKTIKTGRYKTSKEVLNKFLSDEKIQLIFAHKFLVNARGKLEGYKRRAQQGRLHPDYRQTTTSGRAACSNPNLMTIPKQRGRITEIEVGNKELAVLCGDAFRQVRRAFIAPPGSILLAPDYQQIEYRAFVYFSGSARLIKHLKQGEDFHSLICRMVFGEINPRLRHITKIINYGLLYGMGKLTLYKMLRDEGVSPIGVLKKYEAELPEMREVQRAITNTGRRRGYVCDPFGRRYRFVPELPHALVAWLCQGTAANIKKTAMLRVHELLKQRDSKLVLEIHDQLVIQLVFSDVDIVPRIINAMEDFTEIEVPVPVDIAVGTNLLNTVEMDVNGIVNYIERTRNVGNDKETVQKGSVDEKR